MSTSINIVSGLGIPSQIPLNPKENSASEATLKDLGLNNNLAFTYEKGLQVYCRLEGTRYEWREVAIGEELSGLRDTDFIYPSGTITDGVDYSNKKYNFFPVITTALTNEVFIEQGDNITITGTGVELDPFIINGLISPLNKIDEGNGNGIIIRDRISANYGNIGNGAVDFSYNDTASFTKGATGTNSFTINKSNTSSGENSFTGGLNNIASELNSFSFGENNESNKTNSISLGSSIISSGVSAIGIGKGLLSKSFSEIVLGSYNSNYNPISELTWSVTDRLFTIGNGFNEFNRSDAILIYKNGLALLPTVTNSLIENATGKAIITKEYLESILPTTVDGSETKLQAGTNINIIGNGTVTTPYIISSTNEDISQYTNELAIDAVGSVLQNSNTIIFNYDSITPSISADVDINAISSNTGILYGGELSINTNNTFWDISEGIGYIANSLLGTTTKVVWNTMLSNEVDNLSTSLSTYILIDINGNILQQINPPSPEQYRTHIYIGIIDHGSLTNISNVSNETSRMFDISGQIEDLNIALGPINIGNGNIFTYNGSNLNINVSEGSTYRSGSNYTANRFSPSITNEPAAIIANFKRKYRTGVGTWNEFSTSIIDPNYFDNNSGTLVTVPTGKFTVQTLWRFGNSGIINVDYGQQFYDTLGQAKASIGSDYVEYDKVNLKSASRRGWLILKQGITDLSVVGDALFIQTDRFGDKLELGDIFNLQSAYDNSSLPEILTNNTLGALSIRRGSMSDSDNVLEILNNVGSIKTSFTGEGKITTTSFIKTNGLSTEILLANGDSESKNTGFNKPFGTIANTVSEGNHTHTFASLTSKPTTLAGYGITDAVADTIIDGITITAPSQNIVYEALQKKVNLPTGFISGLQLSINADPSKFNIAPGYYTVTDFTDLNNPVVTFKTFVGINGVSPAYLTTANASYIALDIDGNIIQSSSPFSNVDRRTLAIIGSTIHSNNITINVTNEIKAPIIATLNQLHDFMRAVGFLNEEGNIYGANGANLQLNKSVGKIFGLGINASNYLNPHELSIPAQTALTFAYRLRGGTQFADTQNIDPNNYDNNGILTSVTAGNKWTIQHINLFQSGLTRIQYGQTVYNSYNEAVTALPTDPFITEQNIADNAIFRSYLIIKQGTTNITAAISTGTALFVPVDKFGNVIGNGAIALTYSNIIAALGYTPEDVANKVTSLASPNNTTYPTTQLLKDQLDLKQNTLTNSLTGVGSNIDPTTYALQDGTILYHSVKWFTPTGAVSTNGTTVTSVGTQFTSAMVGAKLTINGEWRIITAFTSTKVVTVSSAYSQNYSGIVAGDWGIYSKALEVISGFSRFIDSTGVLVFRTSPGNNVEIANGISSGTNAGFFNNNFSLRSDYRFLFSSTTSAFDAKDLGLRRNSAGVLEIYDGITATGLEANRRDLLSRNVAASKVLIGATVDTDDVLKISNGLGIKTYGVTGNGDITGNTYNGYTPENVVNKVTDIAVGANNTTYPTSLAVKTYADNLVVGMLNDRGSWDASVNLFPTTGGSGAAGAIRKGDMWYVSIAGVLGGKSVNVGDSFRALVNAPAQVSTNWSILEANIGYVPANDANVVHLNGNETITGTKTFASTAFTNTAQFNGGLFVSSTGKFWFDNVPFLSTFGRPSLTAFNDKLSIQGSYGGNKNYAAGLDIDNLTTNRIYSFPNQSGTFALTSDLSDYEPTISPKNTAFNKNFGTTAGTVAEGNDSRFTDARNPLPNSSNYIQNQNSFAQAANMWISGTIGWGGISDSMIFKSPTNGTNFIGGTGSVNDLTIHNGLGQGVIEIPTGTQNTVFRGTGAFASTVTALGGNSTNWNDAYSWGNHANKYVLASVNPRTDPNTQLQSSAFRFDPNANNPTNDYYAISTYGNNGNVTGQLATHYATGQSYTRGYPGSAWSAWRKIWDEGNFNPANYLPLSGGTLSGELYVAENVYVKGTGSQNTNIQFLKDGIAKWITGYVPAISAYRISNGITDVLKLNDDGNSTFSGSVTSSGFFQQSSDRRLKYVHKRDGDVAYFTWKDGRDTKTHIGYIAQEIRKQFPDQVQKNEDDYLSVSYIEILVAKNRDLEKRIEKLEKLISKTSKNGI